jgi:demethylmenaquinone methyltransferase/2-methoxy-6-polyprenyl-1,4-benzoquinol methylase
MLGMARENCPSGYSNSIFLISGVGEALPFKDGAFEAVTVAFGIRNFANLEQGLKEIFRILKDGGTFVALEFSMPDNPIPKFFYNLYLGYIIPLIGLLVARSKAYFYLRDTIKKFPRDHALATILKNTGFTNVEFYKYTTGIVACYRGKKRVI